VSFIRSDEHSVPHSPDDPLYYAPRSVRSEAAQRSDATQTRSDHLPPASSRSRFDEMREEALAKSNRHPLELQFDRERRPRRVLFAIGGIAAAIGVAAAVALLLVNAAPKPGSDPAELAVSISTPALATPAQTTTKDSEELLQGFMQFQQPQGNDNPQRAVSEPASAGTADAPEKSPALLEKFMQWEQRK
jgi:hypothetical protein